MERQRPEGDSLVGAGKGGEAGGNRAPVLPSPTEGPHVTKAVSRPLVQRLEAQSPAEVWGTTWRPLSPGRDRGKVVVGTRVSRKGQKTALLPKQAGC